MEFSTAIEGFNREFNLNMVGDYNKYLQGEASFQFETAVDNFAEELEKASKSSPIKESVPKPEPENFIEQLGYSVASGLNSVNKMKIEADRMQEDLAMGGNTNIHDAMIAAEKAELSMQMAIQVRNRILSAYTEITSMAL